MRLIATATLALLVAASDKTLAQSYSNSDDKDGSPLYLWAGGTALGDTTGDGLGAVWPIAN
jgi:predicted lipoprotein with Yx(FWY)xxD motif